METPYYLAADRRFFETYDRRPVADEEFVGLVRRAAGRGWELARRGIWVHCMPEGARLPLQGWKIHLSSTPQDAEALLNVAAGFLISEGVPFKFLADAATLRMTGAKSWARGASGKFITVYPADAARFRALLEGLAPLTASFRGPYILSDRRYPGSRVLHYRYGGIRLKTRLEADGRRTPVLVTPGGDAVADERKPFFKLPDWERDPFAASDEGGAPGLLGGRFAVEKALHFSNTGGVYVARDSATGARVVLKEARPDVHGFTPDADAFELLRREHEVLRRVEPTGAAPKPIGLFKEWEHLFLAEEYLADFVPLLRFSSRASLFLETAPTREKVAAHLRRELAVVRNLAAAVEALHDVGVVLGDISFNNVLVHPETLAVKVLDLESAQMEGLAPLPRIMTPGFADPAKKAAAAAAVADDYYAVGAILLFLLTRVNGLLGLKPGAWREVLAGMTADFGLPAAYTRALEDLLGAEAGSRSRPSALLASLPADAESVARPGLLEAGRADPARAEAAARAVAQVCRFIKATADPGREDRLFPADPLVFETNPAGLAHGAAGVLVALRRIEGTVDEELVDWLQRRGTAAESCPPGLYSGSAGVAWALSELGRHEEAEALLKAGEEHPLLGGSAGLYDGLAGWGLANIRFWLKTGERRWLRNASDAGRRLLGSAAESPAGLSWRETDGSVQYGLGHGASGVGLFLLSLDRALGGGPFAEGAERALAFDLANATASESGSLSWRRASVGRNTLYPYLRHGSAGVGAVCLRFWKATGDDRYRRAVDGAALDCDRKYAAFPGRNEGLAGLGEFLLDAFLFTGEGRFLEGARRAAAGLELFQVRQEEGLAYPGNGLGRLSCDLATGSAGVALFQDRLLRPRPADFFVDEVLG